jgi:hypothetical protein
LARALWSAQNDRTNDDLSRKTRPSHLRDPGPSKDTLYRSPRGFADPTSWIVYTGLKPTSLSDALAQLPATIQERLFARIYILKALIIESLSIFWILSGLIT